MMLSLKNSPSSLRLRLAPEPVAEAALEATFDAYERMMEIVEGVAGKHNVGANVVLLHAHAYEAVRNQTALPSRLVTLGLRDRGEYRAAARQRLPLDDKLVRIKGPATISIATVQGRFDVPFDYAGYVEGWGKSVPAHLIRTDDGFEIHYGVTPNKLPEEETDMDNITAAPDNFLSRVGRLIAGIAYDAIEQAEGKNKLKVVGQAIREIESAENEAREALAAARAEEYRLNARRSEIEREMTDLAPKIQGAIDDGRDDLARAGIARQMDLEAQLDVLSRAIGENTEKIEQSITSLRAVLSALQDAEQRRADLERSEAAAGARVGAGSAKKPGAASAAAKALRAGRAVARATDVPTGIPFSSDIDELSALHRDKEIAARLARLKSSTSE